MPSPYPRLIVGKRHCRVLTLAAEDTAMPSPYPK